MKPETKSYTLCYSVFMFWEKGHAMAAIRWWFSRAAGGERYLDMFYDLIMIVVT